ncbi:hypothetical protein J8Z28_13520 [Pseudoalteromonas sp. SCSIO 43088]|uniref:hypothetical protein n=1 Tax=Pseudoalteromonas sp. SCSIO 43088 TaxID=2822846 RepID=UPI00202B6243|nr:hypothetical protein [Pseudoalteromonas sp. SCSIO 43088]URQ85561.1 hypothetical protein J8Z28_13520 [Pseudoalteromonas sp. SCSIO 43088]
MYRRTNKTQINYRKSYNKVNIVSAQCEQSDTAVQRIPELRRVIEITDYDKGVATTRRLELYKTNRIDCYRVVVDGKLWKERIG